MVSFCLPGEVPRIAPMLIENASVQYAMVERGKVPVSRSTTPANFAILGQDQNALEWSERLGPLTCIELQYSQECPHTRM